MTISKNVLISVFILVCLAGAIAIAMPHKQETDQNVPLIGVSAYLADCAKLAEVNPNCTSVAAIQAVYNFDVMAEIDGQYQKMKKTAAEIAAGSLTDDAYNTCLKAATCAKVPMLGEGEDPNSEKGKKISKAFWELAEGKHLTPAICDQILVCSVAVQNNALVMTKNKIVPAKSKEAVKAAGTP